MSWIDKILPTGVRKDEGPRRASVPEGLWKKCVKCDAVLYRPDVERNEDVCPKCGHHMRIGARVRLARFLDDLAAPNVGVNFDPANMILYAKGDPVAGLKTLLPYLQQRSPRERVQGLELEQQVRRLSEAQPKNLDPSLRSGRRLLLLQ